MINWCRSDFKGMFSLLPGEIQDSKVKLLSWKKR